MAPRIINFSIDKLALLRHHNKKWNLALWKKRRGIFVWKIHFVIWRLWGLLMKENVSRLDLPPYGFLGYSIIFLDNSFFCLEPVLVPRDQGPGTTAILMLCQRPFWRGHKEITTKNIILNFLVNLDLGYPKYKEGKGTLAEVGMLLTHAPTVRAKGPKGRKGAPDTTIRG